MEKGICAIVVTYNRKNLVMNCLYGIIKQVTQSVSAIVIVDNSSADGTYDTLLSAGLVSAQLVDKNKYKLGLKELIFEKSTIPIYYLLLNKNIGGAGGFSIGLRFAYEKGYEWFWLLDDDVEPEIDCLYNLTKFTKISKCIHPRRRYRDGSFIEWEGYIDIFSGKRISLNDISFRNGKEYCFVNFGCFEGMLIHREIVDKIGFPDERFFIVYDDTVYGFMASLHTNVLYVKDAVLIKNIDSRNTPLSDKFIYYSMRNYFLRVSYLNSIFVKNKIVRYITIVAVFFGYLFYLIRNRRLKSIYYLLMGVIDGFRKNFGKGIF